MAFVEVDAGLRATAALIRVADERAEIVEELVAELGHGWGRWAGSELAAVAVGREVPGLGNGLGFRSSGETATKYAALDAADELEHGFAVRESALPEVGDAPLPDADGLSGGCAVRG
jgi:hypothetical protein